MLTYTQVKGKWRAGHLDKDGSSPSGACGDRHKGGRFQARKAVLDGVEQ